ncbi:MAG TPA: hypothetical protein VMV92_37190 [Streptosporangiaceae bacterium]|nr:hypothetical protein [Streptosporangiaceae bacterium]
MGVMATGRGEGPLWAEGERPWCFAASGGRLRGWNQHRLAMGGQWFLLYRSEREAARTARPSRPVFLRRDLVPRRRLWLGGARAPGNCSSLSW